MKPPSAGPATTATFITAELNAIARGSWCSGTSVGTIACCAGVSNARASPSSTLTPRMRSRPIQCPALPHARSAAAQSITAIAALTTRRRSTRSASCPEGIVKATVGMNCRRPTSPRSHALAVRSYICQPSATSRTWFAAVDNRRVHRKKWKLRDNGPAEFAVPAGALIATNLAQGPPAAELWPVLTVMRGEHGAVGFLLRLRIASRKPTRERENALKKAGDASHWCGRTLLEPGCRGKRSAIGRCGGRLPKGAEAGQARSGRNYLRQRDQAHGRRLQGAAQRDRHRRRGAPGTAHRRFRRPHP